MAEPAQSRRKGPPHNPGVRELVQGKRRWSFYGNTEPRQTSFRGWHERGYLPHRDTPGLTQFVTFRLADSFPESLRSEWEHLHKIEDQRERRLELEAYLDKGKGECHLRRPELASLIETAIRFFHRKRYELRAWVVMSNHVHVLFELKEASMSKIVESWKKYTANQANRVLGRRGAWWAGDYFDTYMRDQEHERRAVHYIENNPVKAKLVVNARDWPWSSARFRDRSGGLCL
jgi:REP element-mobilizing transposase RayT